MPICLFDLCSILSTCCMQSDTQGGNRSRDVTLDQRKYGNMAPACSLPLFFLSLFHPSFKEPVFPGQHMFDQQHSASVLDTNPLLAGPAPMGSIHPPGYESDPWRPSPALQGPTDLSKPRSPHRGHYSLPKNPSALSGCPFSAPSGPQAQVM